MGLTQAAVGHHDVDVTAALLAPLLAPVLDADWLVGLHHIGDLELRVHLRTQHYTCIKPDGAEGRQSFSCPQIFR